MDHGIHDSTHSWILLIMRTYGRSYANNPVARYNREQRDNCKAREWDVRVDVNEQLTADQVVENVKEGLADLDYVLVSGVEEPDEEGHTKPGWRNDSKSGSSEHHVHLCIVLREPDTRLRVLKLVRGPRKMGDEYCAPRNTKFTYAGWVIHHAKPSYKLGLEPNVRFEFGTLPMDPFTNESALSIQRMLAKWGSDAMRLRFKGYTDLADKSDTQDKINKKLATIDKIQDEVEGLRKLL
jgi:hypothetical protein